MKGEAGMADFPRTMVGGVSLPRLLIGSNWMLGWSHRSAAADQMIKRRYAEAEAVAALVKVYLERGIDAMMAPFLNQPALMAGIRLAEEATNRKLILIDTPIIDVTDSQEGRANARQVIEASAKNGATFCLPHHASVEQLVSKLSGRIDRLPDYLDMVRQCGMIPGLSAHMPEIVQYADANQYDVETYIQIYNAAGFLMQVEVETVHKIIWQARKPVMTIKSMAAGRLTPFLNFSFNTLRPIDMVTVGAHTPEEALEDIEFALAAIERRAPRTEKRSSPSKTVLHK